MQLIVKDEKLQKYRDHVQQGTDLYGKDKELFDRYFFAFSQLLDGLSERKVVELLMNCPAPLGQLGQSQAYNVVNGAQEIFGALDYGNSKKVAQRYIYATRLEEMASKLEDLSRKMLDEHVQHYEDDYGKTVSITDPEIKKEAGVLQEKAANILMKAAKLRGLMERDKVENPNKWKVAPNLIFTDDLQGLELLREIEDTGYENVTGDGTEDKERETETTGAES